MRERGFCANMTFQTAKIKQVQLNKEVIERQTLFKLVDERERERERGRYR